MAIRILLSVALVLAAGASRAASPPDARGVADLIAPLLGAVVNITVLKPGIPPPATPGVVLAEAGRAQRAVGSGFIIDPSGLIVSNRHVVADAFKVIVTLHDDRKFPARVLASNQFPDLALLKIDVGEELPVVAFGDSDRLRIGETVIAVGNPLGLSTSVTVGVVSALNRDIGTTLIANYIQTDAAINRGNSGGPLFNLSGEVVGVSWAIVTPNDDSGSVGLGLAIPAQTARLVVDSMRRHGRLIAGYPGMAVQPLTPELARVLRLPGTEGGIVTEIGPDSPAAVAGVREGDVVLQIGTNPTTDARAMVRELAHYPTGSDVPIKVWRDGKVLSLSLHLGTFPPQFDPVGPPTTLQRGKRVTTPTLGLRVIPLSTTERRKLGLTPNHRGVLVDGVAANSLGEELGLATGDLVLQVGARGVGSAEELAASLASRSTAGALLLVRLQARIQWLVVPPGD